MNQFYVLINVLFVSNQMSDNDVILICGDHGMSDQGGHGGASTSETHVPVVLVSPQFKVNKGKTCTSCIGQSTVQGQ